MRKIISAKATSVDSAKFTPKPANANLSAETTARSRLINKAHSNAQAANKPKDRPKLHFSTTPELQRKVKEGTTKPLPTL
jgi:hypothetical protein